MNWDIGQFLVVLGGCKNFQEAQLKLLKEGVRQLEASHLDIALRTYDPTDIGIELLRAGAVQAELEAQAAMLQEVINKLGGPHGTGEQESREAEGNSGGPAGQRIAPRSQPAACDQAERPADSPGESFDVAIRTGHAAPPWGSNTPGSFSEYIGRPRSSDNPHQ